MGLTNGRALGPMGRPSGIPMAMGGAFFSDLCHFSGFADFSRFADFGCLKHITKANHLLSSHSGNEGKTDALRINPHFLKNFSPSLSA